MGPLDLRQDSSSLSRPTFGIGVAGFARHTSPLNPKFKLDALLARSGSHSGFA